MQEPEAVQPVNHESLSSVASLVREIEQVLAGWDSRQRDVTEQQDTWSLIDDGYHPCAATLWAKAPRLLRSVLGVLRARAEEEKNASLPGTTGRANTGSHAPVEATYRLCYVDGPWAYFTSKPLSEQWGDDWNDAPYEHNAEPPYEPVWHAHSGSPGLRCSSRLPPHALDASASRPTDRRAAVSKDRKELADGVLDANGNRWVFRLTSSVLERRAWASSVWFRVTGELFMTMTPDELRHVADVVERTGGSR